MKFVAVLVLSIAAAANAAEPVLIASGKTGERVELFADAGPCQFGARAAAWVSATQRIDGCWRVDGDLVAVAFFDGDALRIPKTAFSAPQTL